MTLTTELTGLDYSVYCPRLGGRTWQTVFHGSAISTETCVWETIYSDGTSNSLVVQGDGFGWARYMTEMDRRTAV